MGTGAEQIDKFSEKTTEKMSEKRQDRDQRNQDNMSRQLNYNSIMNLKPFKSNAVTLERDTIIMGLSDGEVRIIGIVLLTALFGIIVWKIIDWLKDPVEITE